jgi:hypothetical protein
MWYIILDSIHDSINQEMAKKYKYIDMKLNKLTQTQAKNHDYQGQFYPRVINTIDITFTNDELSPKQRFKIQFELQTQKLDKTLALEAETAITQLPMAEKVYVRFQVAHNIKQLYKQYNRSLDRNTIHMKRERHILNNIKDKLMTNKAIVSKADTGNSFVITYLDEYHKKILDFISNNNFSTAKNNLTKTFQRDLRNTINECQLTIHKDDKWKYINLNPSAPTIRGLLKIHKTDSSIRPVANWQNAPAYKLAKFLSKQLQIHVSLLYTFNVKNSIQLINDLLDIPFDLNLWFFIRHHKHVLQ